MCEKLKHPEKYFHVAPWGYNCAQSVLKAYVGQGGISEEDVERAKAWGGGRAEGGLCGALYAANIVAERLGKASLTEGFRDKIGHTRCADIKSKKRVSCVECIRIADELLAE